MPDPSPPKPASSFLTSGPLIGFLAGILATLSLRLFPGLFGRLVDGFPPLVLLLVWLIFWQAPRPSTLPGASRDYRVHHRAVLVFLVAAALAFSFFYMRLAQPSLYDAVCLAFFPMMAATVIAYGAGWLNLKPTPARYDEPARLFRARAVRAGYIVLTAMLGATYFVAVYEPRLVPVLLRLSLFLGVGVPAAAFLALDWWAARQDSS